MYSYQNESKKLGCNETLKWNELWFDVQWKNVWQRLGLSYGMKDFNAVKKKQQNDISTSTFLLVK